MSRTYQSFHFPIPIITYDAEDLPSDVSQSSKVHMQISLVIAGVTSPWNMATLGFPVSIRFGKLIVDNVVHIGKYRQARFVTYILFV